MHFSLRFFGILRCPMPALTAAQCGRPVDSLKIFAPHRRSFRTAERIPRRGLDKDVDQLGKGLLRRNQRVLLLQHSQFFLETQPECGLPDWTRGYSRKYGGGYQAYGGSLC